MAAFSTAILWIDIKWQSPRRLDNGLCLRADLTEAWSYSRCLSARIEARVAPRAVFGSIHPLLGNGPAAIHPRQIVGLETDSLT